MTVAVPVPSTSDAAWWVGCACSASGLDLMARSLGRTSTMPCSPPPTSLWPRRVSKTSRSWKDNLFATSLEPASFDLVHARYEITPLGRGPEQMTTYLQLVRPGGTVVLEDPDVASWHFNPPAPALEKLITLIVEAFRRTGGDWDAGRKHLDLFGIFGIEANVRAELFALAPGDPYLRLPLQFATALEGRLLSLMGAGELERLRNDAEVELNEPGRWGTTFTLIQSWGRRAG